jgi:hypothetical protein
MKPAIMAFVALLVLAGCGAARETGTPATPSPRQEVASPSPAPGSSLAAASDLAAKYGLHLQSQVDSVRARVPRRLRFSKVWAIAESAAEDIGLSLRPSRGQTVTVTTYALAERVHKHPAFLCIAVRHGDVAAAWVRLGPGPEPGSLEGPGVYSLEEVAQW